MTILTMPIIFKRRRYGSQTFTWAYALRPDGGTLSLGDPWPCVTPKQSEIEKALEQALKEAA